MGRKRKGRPISGWLVLDKDYDFGSTEAVARAKRLFDAQKAGHAGALDPLATGVLPIAFGEATKTVSFVMAAKKRYRFVVRWGVATSTDDAEGGPVATSDARPGKDQIEAALARFIGEIEQVPPRYSAVKIGGERAYDLAREGERVELTPRLVAVHEFRLMAAPDRDHAEFEAVTGKGAYVRALARDLARALGTEGHIAKLRRLAVGPFAEAEAVGFRAIEALSPEDRDALLKPAGAALASLPQAAVGPAEVERLRLGQAAILSPAVARGVRAGEAGALPAVAVSFAGDIVAICELDGLKLKPLRVFNL